MWAISTIFCSLFVRMFSEITDGLLFLSRPNWCQVFFGRVYTQEKAIIIVVPEEMSNGICKEGIDNWHLFVTVQRIIPAFEPDTTTRCLTFSIILLSVISAGQFSVRLSEEGFTLLLIVTWCKPFVNIGQLHSRWLTSKSLGRIEMYRLKMVGFEQLLKSCRIRNTDYVESTVRITLPFPVQTHISQTYNLRWTNDSGRVMYIELRGHE